MSADTALTLDLRLGGGRQLCYFLQLWCMLLQIHLRSVAFSAVQLRTLVGPLCIPSTSQTLERVKGSLGTKSCLHLRAQIQITQGAAGPGVPRGWGSPREAGQGLAARVCPTGPAREQGRPGGTRDSPSPWYQAALGTGCGEPEAGPAAVSVGLGQMAVGSGRGWP